MNEKINIRGVYFDNVTPQEASAREASKCSLICIVYIWCILTSLLTI